MSIIELPTTHASAAPPDGSPEPPRLRLVVLQPTSRCNLDCRYCYVPDRESSLVMDEATLSASFKAVFAAQMVRDDVDFLWHAGEPLTAGIAFYERAFDVLETHRPHGLGVTQSVQTNGTLVTRAWARLFQSHDVNVGVSIDGPAHLHDARRVTWAGRGSHAATVRGIRTLLEHGVSVGALCVISAASLDDADAIYDEFIRLGIRSVGLNVEEVEGAHRRSTLTPEHAAAYQRFLERLWRRWREEPQRLEIREFDRTLRVLAAARADDGWCRVPDDTIGFRMITITKLGNVSTYSPELAGTDQFTLGNVHRDSLDELAHSEAYTTMRNAVDAGVAACRRRCPYFRLCGGGYVSNKFFEHGRLEAWATTTCQLHRQRLIDTVLGQLANEVVRTS